MLFDRNSWCMEQVKKDMINRYIVTFKNKIAIILKDDVSIKSTVLPYKTGAILVFSFDFNGSGNTEFKSESNSFTQALNKLSSQIEGLTEQSKMLFSGRRIIEVKTYDENEWTTSSAQASVDSIIKALTQNERGRH